MTTRPDSSSDLPSTWTAWKDTLGVAWRASPSLASARISIAAANAAVEGVGLGYALKQVIDAGAGGRPAVGWVVALVGFAVAPRWFAIAWDHVQHLTLLRTQQLVRQEVMAAVSLPVGIDHLESPRHADRVDQLMRSPERVSILFDWLASQIGLIVALAAAFTVLLSLHPILVLPVVAGGAVGSVTTGARRRALALMDKSTSDQRLGDKIVTVSTATDSAFDVRMLGLGPWLVDQHRASRQRVRRQLLAGERGVLVGNAIASTVQAALLTAAVALVVRLAVSGRLDAGEVALALVVIRTALIDASGLAASVADLARNTFVAKRYSWLVRHRGDVPRPTAPIPAPHTLAQGIEFRGVTFTYPETSEAVVRDVDLWLPAGTTVALVGENGAGKSTLVKLLCRFYDPSEGSITVDGTDLRDLNPESWRARLTGTFQDFQRYQFVVGRSIGIGDLTNVDSIDEVARAAQAGGAARFIDRMPSGYRTQLGRGYDGEELSEGQWQAVAASRAAMRLSPLVVLLDEPTAALDPKAEHELFERSLAAAAAARERGAVTVVVSHRFSTARMADLVVVLARGRVVEQGTHDQLMAAQGTYAELYALQAARYTS